MVRVPGADGDPGPTVEADQVLGAGPEIHGATDHPREGVAAAGLREGASPGLRDRQPLGPDRDASGGALPWRPRRIAFEPRTVRETASAAPVRDLLHRHVQQVGLADEVRDEAVARFLVDLVGRADLAYLPRRHHRDAVGHRQRLLLVVGDEHEGDAGLLLELLQLDAHGLAQLEIERRERLVEQEDLRARGHGAGERHPLLLPSGELVRLALREAAELDHVEHAPRARLDLGRGPLQPPHPERDVLGHRHVGEERVLLEDGVHRPPVGRQPLDLLAVEEDRALGHVLEPRDHAQQRGLAAAGRAEEGEELVVRDLQARAPDRGEGPVALHHVAKLDRRRTGRGRLPQAPFTSHSSCRP